MSAHDDKRAIADFSSCLTLKADADTEGSVRRFETESGSYTTARSIRSTIIPGQAMPKKREVNK